MPTKITIKEVARRAGVATMTVSRVLNGSGYVSGDAKARVERAVEELGYMPNQLARGLRSKKTGTIALVVTDITNPFFTTVARGVEDAASDKSNLVLFCNTDEKEDEEKRYMRLLIEKRVDGILLVPAESGRDALHMARAQGVPLVVLDRAVSDPSFDVVRCDSARGTSELARLLVKAGHSRFAILAGHSGVSTTVERVGAFTQAVGAGGVDVFHGEFTVASGYANALAAMALKPRPTAIFAINNFISIGALAALRDQGVRVPEEVALVGFDDLPASMVVSPFLTVVSQPADRMGHEAVRLLFRRIENPTAEPQHLLLPTELIVRGSSGEG